MTALRSVGDAVKTHVKTGAIATGVVAALVSVTDGLGVGAAGRLVLFAASIAAFAIGVFQAVNSVTRPLFGHWERDVGAAKLLIVEAFFGALLIGFGTYGMLATDPRAWLLALAYFPPAVLYWQLEVDIAAKVLAGRKRLGTWHVMSFRPFGGVALSESSVIAQTTPQGGLLEKVFGPLPPEDAWKLKSPRLDARLFDWAKLPDDIADDVGSESDWTVSTLRAEDTVETVRTVASTSVPPRGQRASMISVTRVWVAIALAAVFLLCGATAVGEAAESVVDRYVVSHKPARARRSNTTTTTTTTNTTRPTPPPAGPAPVPPTADPPERVYWMTICVTLPGAGAPAWARQPLYDAYLGINGYGALEAGCTGRTYRIGDHFVFQEGRDPATGALRSVAVVSQRWPAAIFLSPAARLARDLIGKFGAVGGGDRHDVLNGDYQLVYTPAGTFTLVRETKTQTLDRRPTKYVELPPAVSEEWYAATRRAGWLWPELVSSSNGVQTFRFVHSAITKGTVEMVRYDVRAGRAFRLHGTKWIPYAAVGREIPDSAIHAAAAGAQ